ncbi:hypothetical protein QFC22_003381 [Naganishia vaughanmartiniae]|uniref:Uncharacterized protein n=1 Tax=Naganishia vaughanmartiniae TaxID=1424756 RepID=A0ACC2X8B5_9TREE|nr:hypothetical protein QFC22_003381 [Naganishia vaughanmartiniae]
MVTSTKRKQEQIQAVAAAVIEPSSKKPKTTGSAPSFAGSWDKLKPILTPWILETIHTTFGFTNLTPVQASLIPLAISKNKDFLVEAVTGSGKTLSYVVPILERLVAKEAEMAKERGSAGSQGGTGVKGLRRNEVFALVVVPTRELAVQVHAVFELFFQGLRTYVADQKAMNSHGKEETTDDATQQEQQPLETTIIEEIYPSPLLLVSGQTTTSKSTTALPAPSPIIIGTPGRVASYLSTSLSTSSSSSTSAFARARKHLSLTPFSLLILDEADSLLSSPDHLRNMHTIWQTVPRQRRNWLFSATMMDVLSERTNGLLGQTGLERAGLKNLTRVVVKVETKVKGREQEGNEPAAPAEVKQRRTPVSLQNTYILCHAAEKTLQLVRALCTETTNNEHSKFIVYFSTCAAVDYFYRILRRLPELSHFHFSSLHGHLPPPIRTSTLSTFTSHTSTPLRPSVLLCTDVAARGLDLPDVDVVVQYDAPMDPKVFSHRAGRAARMGRQGKGIVLLTKGSEEGYIEFLALRKIPLRKQAYIGPEAEDQVDNEGGESSTAAEKSPFAVDPAADAMQLAIQNIVLEDRDLADKAAKAFVSAVRAYSKHEASYIFRLRDLDVFGMGKSFGLLRLPRMPEIRDWKDRVAKARERQEKGKAGDDDERLISSTWQDRDMNWDEFAYVSKTREAQRLAELKEAESKKDEIAAEREQAAKARREMAEKRVAWSVKKDRKDRKDVRREKKDRKKDWEAKEAKRLEVEAGEHTLDKPTAQSSATVASDGDDDDEMDEYREAKKSKKEHTGGNMIQSDMFDDLS